MTYKELEKLFHQKNKSMTKTKIAIAWGVSTQNLEYWLSKAKVTPNYPLPKGRILK